VRGKAGTALGRLAGLLAVVKGIPLAYDRDLQEDKAPVFAARRDVDGSLEALAVLIGGLEVDRDRAAQAASDPTLLATDAAEALVAAGTPFRDAFEQVAEAVREGALAPPVDAAASVAARAAPGPGGVHEALAAARERLDAVELHP
jgi:argininosuccinate lyase